VIIKLQTAMVLLNKGELHIQVCRSATRKYYTNDCLWSTVENSRQMFTLYGSKSAYFISLIILKELINVSSYLFIKRRHCLIHFLYKVF